MLQQTQNQVYNVAAPLSCRHGDALSCAQPERQHYMSERCLVDAGWSSGNWEVKF